MPSSCCIPGCKSNYKTDGGNVKVFQFPSRAEKLKEWIEKIPRKGFTPGKRTVVCIRHFKEEHIVKEDVFTRPDGTIVEIPRRNYKLTVDAVPCLFPDLSLCLSDDDTHTKRSSEKCEQQNTEEPKTDDFEGVQVKQVKAKDFAPKKIPVIKMTKASASSSSYALHKSLKRSSTTNRPIITAVKAEAISSDRTEVRETEQKAELKLEPETDSCDNLFPSSENASSISSTHVEEKKKIPIKENHILKKRSSSVGSNSSSGSTETCRSSSVSSPKKRKIEKPPPPTVVGRKNDCYCWVCHKENIMLCCVACPRAYHFKCAGQFEECDDWICVECQRLLKAENMDNLSPVFTKITLDQFCTLLKLSLNKIKYRAPAAFHQPVPVEYYPAYPDYVINPMDLSQIEKNIKQKLYGCKESYLADIKWILHNSCVFNGTQHPLSANAKSLVKTCEYDMGEIDVCPDCFLHACVRNKYWFADVCQRPHSLVWAKLKGFPYWPAKVVRIVDGNVDARFFGAHDRAWVPVSQCYHLSKEMPTSSKPKKKGTYETALDELNVHVHLLMQRFGTFEYADYRTPFDPNNKLLCYHGIDIDKVVKMEGNSYQVASLCSKDSFNSMSGMDIKEEEVNEMSCSQESSILSPKENIVDEVSSTVNASSESSLSVNQSSHPSSDTIENSTLSVGKKSPPVGVFEVSNQIQFEMPSNLKISNKALNIKPVVTISKKDQKIASALERIKEIICSDSVKSENEIKTGLADVPKDSLLSDEKNLSTTVNDSDSKPDESRIESVPETKKSEDMCINEEQIVKSDDNTDSHMPVLSSKKSDLFALKLDETIESCKAKLGITEIVEDETSDESCDDEGEREEDESSSETDDEADEDQSSGAEEDSRTESVDTDIEELDDSTGAVEQTDDCMIVESSENKGDDETSKTPGDKGEDEAPKTPDDKGEDEASENNAQPEEVKKTEDKDSIQEIEATEQKTLQTQSVAENDTGQVESGELIEVENADTEEKRDSDSEKKEDNLSVIHSDCASPEKGDHSEILDCTPVDQQKEMLDNSITSVHSSPEIKIIAVSGNFDMDSQDMDMSSPIGNSTMDTEAEEKPVVREIQPEVVENDVPHEMPNIVDRLQLEIDEIKQRLAALKKAYEKQQWFHAQENAGLQHNLNLIVVEMKASLETDKKDALQCVQKQHETEKSKCIEETKIKQWCANCRHEAVFLCCWNTSYCSHFCQKHHWPKHMHHCRQIKPSTQAFTSELSKVTNTKLDSGDVSDGHSMDKKVIFVNVKSSDLLSSGIVTQSLSPTIPASQVLDTTPITQPLLAKPQIQLVTSKPPLQLIAPNLKGGSSRSSPHFQIVPSSSVQILTPIKPPNETGIKPLNCANSVFKDSSEIITKVRSRQTNLQTAIAVLKEMNKETAATTLSKKDKPSKADNSEDEEEIHFKIPDNNVDGVLAAEEEDNDEENDILSDGDGSLSAEECPPDEEQAVLSVCSTTQNGSDMVAIADGIVLPAKALNRCLAVSKTPAKLTRLLMALLFPDISLLAKSCVFGRRSNFTKKTRPALPTNLVQAIIDYVQKYFPEVSRSEIVLVMNLKCKDARRTLLKTQAKNASGSRTVKRKIEDDEAVVLDPQHEKPTGFHSSPKRAPTVANMLKSRLLHQSSSELQLSPCHDRSTSLWADGADSPSLKSSECQKSDSEPSPIITGQISRLPQPDGTSRSLTYQSLSATFISSVVQNPAQQSKSSVSSPSCLVEDEKSANDSSQKKTNKSSLPNSVVAADNSSLSCSTSVVLPNSKSQQTSSATQPAVNSVVMNSSYTPLEMNGPPPLIIYRSALSAAFQFGPRGSPQVELAAPNSTSSLSSACVLTSSPQLHSLLTKKDS